MNNNKVHDWIMDNVSIPCIEDLVASMEKDGVPKEDIDRMVQQLIDNNETAIQSVAAGMLKRYTKDPENYPFTDEIIK
jgi:hypothetical protein